MADSIDANYDDGEGNDNDGDDFDDDGNDDSNLGRWSKTVSGGTNRSISCQNCKISHKN